ncbi:MAG: hypothetical protein HOV80_07640 [Polyangiaceae bacterium]|nr:hypothetical protein [Polyangiaceae bacterium]
MRLLFSVSVFAASLLIAGAALADQKQECRDAYYKTQVLRDEGKLDEALEQAGICVRTCGDELSSNCAQWKTELEGRLASSIIVEVVDESGASLNDVTVSLDGVLWLDHLDGSPQNLSKGPHTLEVTAKGAAPEKKSIVIQAGEKGRKITISITTKAPEAEPPNGAHVIGPWVVGGVGVGALIAGAVTGGIVIHDHSVMEDNCDEKEGTCSQDGLDASERGQVLGPVTTSLLVAGGVLVAGGIVWFLVAPDEAEPATTSWYVVPAISSHEASVVLGGSW